MTTRDYLWLCIVAGQLFLVVSVISNCRDQEQQMRLWHQSLQKRMQDSVDRELQLHFERLRELEEEPHEP